MYISPLCVDEFLHEFGKALRSKIPANDFFISLEKALSSILSLPYLSVVNPPVDRASHKKIVSIMKTFALRPRDAYHLLTMQAHGIDGFATFDTDFEKVFAAKLLESM
jgi:predicted nucleic acid-binding protein